VPLVLRGKAETLSWIPKVAGLPLRESTIARLHDLYAHTDPALARAFAHGMEIARVAEGDGQSQPPPARQPGAPPPPPVPHREFIEPAEAAARFMSTADGPRVGVLSYNGWDTHANEGPAKGQLANRLAGLDAAIAALETGMGAAWKDTAALIVTEFGRTARVNGTAGTDHGMATVALCVGGAVAGGRVVADWPGLSAQALFEGRDLKPTLDLRALMKGLLRDHLGIPPGALDATVFPSSTDAKGIDGLVA
jgi:uncharacterized protein (DUF1501 family)